MDIIRFATTILFATLSASMAESADTENLKKCQRILRAYCPSFEAVFLENSKIFFKLSNGERIICDDGVDLDMLDNDQYAQQINNPDLAASLEWEYPMGVVEFPVTKEDGDPGRIRVEPLFLATYGANEAQVKSNLVSINFLGKKIQFNSRLGAAEALKNVSADFEKIVGFKEKFWKSREFSGSFNWRKVAGTNRLSVHSFGAAIDFTIIDNNSKHSYWQWVSECITPGCDKLKEENLKVKPVDEKTLDLFAINDSGLTPAEVVSVFEKHGFIWGGKWYHFDTMHFEYRPEFLGFDSQAKCALEDDLAQLVW